MLRVAVGQAYLAFGISQLLSVNMPSQGTATVTVMLFLVVAQLCSGVDMISCKEMRHALPNVPWQTVASSLVCVKRLPSNCSLFECASSLVCQGWLFDLHPVTVLLHGAALPANHVE